MTAEQTNLPGKVGKFIEAVDVEKVLPISTATEKWLRFAWERRPSERFLMTWNQCMEPNQVFIEELNEQGLTVTVRWGLMKQPPEKIAEVLNRWLEKAEGGTYRPSGNSGRHLG